MHGVETKINRRFLGLQDSEGFFQKDLTEDLALSKGIEWFYEFVFYTIILSLPIYEMYVSSINSRKEKELLNNRIGKMETNISDLKDHVVFQGEQMIQNLKNLKEEVKESQNQMDNTIFTIIHWMNELKNTESNKDQLSNAQDQYRKFKFLRINERIRIKVTFFIRIIRDQEILNKPLSRPGRNLVKGETNLYVQNQAPLKPIIKKDYNGELIDISQENHGHNTLADCYYRYNGRETGGFHMNKYVIDQNITPHLAQRNIYVEHPFLSQENNQKYVPDVYPRASIKDNMRRNMKENLIQMSENAKLINLHINELGGIEDTVGSYSTKK